MAKNINKDISGTPIKSASIQSIQVGISILMTWTPVRLLQSPMARLPSLPANRI